VAGNVFQFGWDVAHGLILH
jgi:hypothetical protein